MTKSFTSGTPKSRIALAAALGAALMLAGAGRASAYTVVTQDGHIILAQARPEIRGLQAYMRLAPKGTLAVIQEEQIDWARTEAANPDPARFSVPADARMAHGAQAGPKPIELKIMGAPGARAAQEPAPGPAGAAPAAAASAEGAPDQKKANAQEAIVKLQKEYAQVAAARDGAAEKKKSLEAELEKLQAKQVGYASDDNASAKRMRDLQQQIDEVSGEIGRYESRLNDIRAEAVQMGGSID